MGDLHPPFRTRAHRVLMNSLSTCPPLRAPVRLLLELKACTRITVSSSLLAGFLDVDGEEGELSGSHLSPGGAQNPLCWAIALAMVLQGAVFPYETGNLLTDAFLWFSGAVVARSLPTVVTSPCRRPVLFFFGSVFLIVLFLNARTPGLQDASAELLLRSFHRPSFPECPSVRPSSQMELSRPSLGVVGNLGRCSLRYVSISLALELPS